MTITEAVQEVVCALLKAAQRVKKEELTIQAGELKKVLKFEQRVPICCQAMRKAMRDGDEILEEPPQGDGTRLKIRYKLPRK